jgi:hypothetical protein
VIRLQGRQGDKRQAFPHIRRKERKENAFSAEKKGAICAFFRFNPLFALNTLDFF